MTTKPAKMQIFRGEDAPSLAAAQIMEALPLTAVQAAALKAMNRPGVVPGGETKVLFNLAGFSLVHAWFKSNYPLALHSHNVDCLYYVVAGSLKLGTERLGPRDGFFVPAGVPYRYTAGPDGVEILEFRHESHFDLRVLAKGEQFWTRAVQTVEAHQTEWRDARPPSPTIVS